MDWEKLTNDVVVAATGAFSSLVAERTGEHFYAFALYTDEYGETICPSANSIEQHKSKILKTGETDKLQVAAYMWSTAEWAYEYWNADLFTGVYKELEKYRKSLPDTKSDEELYKNCVLKCMIEALKRMKENGFFANIGENIMIFISSSNDDEAFDLENYSAKELNSEPVYLSFIERYNFKN